MSAYLSSCDALCALDSYWHESIKRNRTGTPPNDYITNATYHGTPGIHWHDAKAKAEQLCAGRNPAVVVFELLLAENQASLEARYPGDLEYRSAEGYSYSADPEVRRSVLHNRTGWITGILDGYEYQSCEHKGWRHSIGKELCHQMRQFLCDDLRRLQDPDRKRDFWASYSRQEHDRPAIATTVPV